MNLQHRTANKRTALLEEKDENQKKYKTFQRYETNYSNL